MMFAVHSSCQSDDYKFIVDELFARNVQFWAMPEYCFACCPDSPLLLVLVIPILVGSSKSIRSKSLKDITLFTQTWPE